MTEKNKMNISKLPKTKPSLTDDGIATGLQITLHDSVALDGSILRRIPAGTKISKPLSVGENWELGKKVVRVRVAAEGNDIEYSA